jgi:hypothetical protein
MDSSGDDTRTNMESSAGFIPPVQSMLSCRSKSMVLLPDGSVPTAVSDDVTSPLPNPV